MITMTTASLRTHNVTICPPYVALQPAESSSIAYARISFIKSASPECVIDWRDKEQTVAWIECLERWRERTHELHEYLERWRERTQQARRQSSRALSMVLHHSCKSVMWSAARHCQLRGHDLSVALSTNASVHDKTRNEVNSKALQRPAIRANEAKATQTATSVCRVVDSAETAYPRARGHGARHDC